MSYSSRVSIKDIARAAGVSHSTVSRALHNSPLISTETRERIQALASAMGYIPDAVAQSLQTRRTNTIGMVITSLADPFFVEVTEGVEEVARSAGMSVFFNSSHNKPEQEIDVIETFDRRRVDGIIVASSQVGSRYTERLARVQVPVVLINSQASGEQELFHSVAVDDRAGARLAVEHLLALGHRRIAYLGVSNRPKTNRRRYEGYVEAMTATGISVPEEWLLHSTGESDSQPHDVDAGRSMVAHLIGIRATAVFCYNDMLAIGVLLGCRDHGICVPAEMSVIGFDDIELTRYMQPTLSTIHQPKRELGQLSMRMMLDLLDQREVTDHILQPQLKRRESTGPVPT